VAILKIILKKALLGAGFVVLILLYLFFIFWIDIFRNLGSGFPYLFVFLLPSLLYGFISKRSPRKMLVRGTIPLISALAIYLIYVASFAGLLRFGGWVMDMWFLILIYIAAVLTMLYLGWRHRTQIKTKKIWTALLLSLLIIFATALQFRFYISSKYYYIIEGIQSFFPQNLETKSHQEAFGILCDYIDRNYPYFEYKHLDWEKIKKEVQEELKTVKTNEEYHKAVARMLRYLEDEHVWIQIPDNKKQEMTSFGADHIKIAEKWIVIRVYPGSSADKSGIKPGMELIAINNQPVKDALAAVPEYLLNAKSNSIRGQRFGDLLRLRHLLIDTVGTKISLSYLKNDGKEKSVEGQLSKIERKSAEQAFAYKRLPEGYGYIKMKMMILDPISLVPTFDKALEKLWHTKGSIIDIRGNPGGAIVLTDQILGRFTKRKINYGGILNTEGKFAPLYVVPRHPVYDHPVVILIDERCASAADYFSYAASYLDNVTLVGRPTRGVVSSPTTLMRLPGKAEVSLVGSGLADPSGNYVVEWTGVPPDVYIPYSISDIQAGIDRDLLEGIEILEKGE
jgi:C-terminal processing protease CtpA/Prc